MRSIGTSDSACLLTLAAEIKELAMEWTSATETGSVGSPWCEELNCQSATMIKKTKILNTGGETIPKMPKNNAGLTSLVCRLDNPVHLYWSASDSGQYVTLLLIFRGVSFGALRSLVVTMCNQQSQIFERQDHMTYGERYSCSIKSQNTYPKKP